MAGRNSQDIPLVIIKPTTTQARLSQDVILVVRPRVIIVNNNQPNVCIIT